MNELSAAVGQRLAQAASDCQQRRTGHAPRTVTVALSGDTLVVTLQEALTLAEIALARSSAGAAQVQEFHRQLFANSTDEFCREIERLTGREVLQAATEIDPGTGAVIHAFPSGTMVQAYFLSPGAAAGDRQAGLSHPLARAEDDGLRVSADDQEPGV